MRLLVLNFFPAFSPPSSGGELRLGNLYRALSAHHDVTLLTSTDFGARHEEVRHTERFTEWRFPKDQLWAKAYATLEETGLAGDLSGLAFALAVSDPDCALRRLARELAPQMDRVIHEFPFSEPIFADMAHADTASPETGRAAAPREIYNSHNFETSLLGSVVQGAGFDAALLKLMRLEGNLAHRAELVLATSAADAEKFRLFYGVPAERLALCPNGFDAAELEPVARARISQAGRQRDDQIVAAEIADARAAASHEGGPSVAGAVRRPKLLFTGSAHPPNVEAARFLAKLAAALPECDVVLAGSVSSALEGSAAPGSLPANLLRLGPFEPATKQRLLIDADLFLNPVTLGSGTSLKALEALGAGLAMVSTAEGVRGLGVEPGVQAAVVERSRFAETIRALLADPAARARLAAAGRDLAEQRFTWSAIADALATCLETVAAPASATPLVLALNDYPVLSGNSGGMARVRGLLGQAGAEVVLVSFGAQAEFVLLEPGLLHVTLPKTAAHLSFELALSDGQPVSANDVAAALFVGASPLMAAVLSQLAHRAAVVLMEHCYMAPALDLIASARAGYPQARLPIIYSSHNVETTHKPPLLAGHVAQASLSRFVASLEARLVGTAELIVCCTASDARDFASLALDASRARSEATGLACSPATIIVVQNGCAVPSHTAARIGLAEASAARSEPAIAGFLGSAHGPNVEAALFILRELAPRLPRVTFEMVGGLCEALAGGGPWPDNVRLRGVLDETEKSMALAGWTIALNPVTGGGGSSLKLPDYMAHGLPSLSTPAGARGFAVAEKGAGVVVEQHLFARQLAALLAEPDRLAEMGERARGYAQQELSWQAVTVPYRAELAHLLAPRLGRLAALPDRPRLLVVTYRYTEPTLGGAEEYLVEVLRRLRPRVARLDLACVDVGPLTNHHHFATRSGPAEGVTRRLGEVFDQLHCLAADAVDEPTTLAHCRDLERAWTAEEELLLLPFARRLGLADRPVLFAGFYWPENHDGVLRRWTGPHFSILVPADACVLRLAGWVSQSKRLQVEVLRLPPAGSDAAAGPADALMRLGRLEQRLSGNFVTNFGLPALSGAAAGDAASTGMLLLRLAVEETQSPGDHRPFGVLLEAVSILRKADGPSDRPGTFSRLEERAADFAADNDRLLRAMDFAGWVTALNTIAAQRSPTIEAAFAAVRGPHSTALQDWLVEHGGDYDVALIQGVPFDLVPSTVATLSALPRPPRLVTLPHFHADDRFYHWRRFADSFAKADATLVFTHGLPALLAAGDPALERRFAVVPGGGVRPDEHADATAHRRFAEAHPGKRPFFLVLGRKTPSKGYRRVLAAHAARRSADPDSADLVLIGPDEDGQPVEAPGAVYLGRQPREVIRGALAACIAVITMSESESFGIVLCEAWLFGRPVIANAACYSFRDLVDAGRTGLLVQTDAELAAAMGRLGEDAALANAMGQAGYQVVQDNYTWPQVAGAVADVLWPAMQADTDIPALNRPLATLDAV